MNVDPGRARTRGDLAVCLRDVLPGAGDPSYEALARAATIRAFRRHEPVLSQTDDARLTLILEGYVGPWRSDAQGNRQMITIVGPGEFASVLSLAGDGPNVDLIGLEDGMAALWFGPLVTDLARGDAGLAMALLDHALRSARRLLNRLERVTFDSVSRRLAMILWVRRDLLFDVRRPLLSRPQLADLAGATREMTGRVIRDLEQRGIVGRTGATGLVLLDPAGLRAAGGLDEDASGPGGSPSGSQASGREPVRGGTGSSPHRQQVCERGSGAPSRRRTTR